MSANDQYLIREVSPGWYEVYHLDMDNDELARVCWSGRDLREAISWSQAQGAEYGICVEFFELAALEQKGTTG